MYAFEFHITVEDEALMPSTEELEATFRRHGGSGSERIEHISVSHGARESRVVAFVTARSALHARRLAGRVGEAVEADLPDARLDRLHMWRDDQI